MAELQMEPEWYLNATLSLLQPIAKRKFCVSLARLINDPQHCRYFNGSVMIDLQHIGKTRSLGRIPSASKVYGLQKDKATAREVFFRITSNHFGHAIEKQITENNTRLFLLDIVYPGQEGWESLQSLIEDVRDYRDKTK